MRPATVCGLCVVACLCSSNVAAFGKGSKPVITGLNAAPATVASGGATTVSASVSGAMTCTLSSNKSVSGLPATFSCESGNVSREVVMPGNYGKKALSYKLTLLATGAGGKGKGKATVSVTPVPPPALGVAAGGTHSCALMYNGHIECWGADQDGQLGNGKATLDKDAPVAVQKISSATEVSAGYDHTCALLSSGHVECWGRGVGGALGNGVSGNVAAPVEVHAVTNASQVSAAGLHTCARLSTGHIECWGDNQAGELGNGSMAENAYTPVEVQGIGDATQVGGGEFHACAVLSTGRVECWGENQWGQLGIGSNVGPEMCLAGACSTTPLEVPSLTDATEVAGGERHTCALLSTGHVMCWGADANGQLGNGTTTEVQDSPVEVQGITNAIQISAGREHTCAVLSTGKVECWGLGAQGQLGTGGTIAFVDTPNEVLDINDATQTAAGEHHTCALLSGGRIDCWGDGGLGELGGGLERESDVPVEVLGI